MLKTKEAMKEYTSYKPVKWRDINIKEQIAIISACAVLCIGWTLVTIGFLLSPQGEVHDSVLWILGQTLIYAASVFGLAGYMSSQVFSMKKDINDHFRQMEQMQIEREQMQLERDRLRQGIDYGETPNDN